MLKDNEVIVGHKNPMVYAWSVLMAFQRNPEVKLLAVADHLPQARMIADMFKRIGVRTVSEDTHEEGVTENGLPMKKNVTRIGMMLG